MTDVNLSSVLGGGGGGLPAGTVAQVPASFRGPAPEGWSYGGEVLSKTDNAALFAALGHEPNWYDQPVIDNEDLQGGGRLHYILEVGATLWGFGENDAGYAAVFTSVDGGVFWTTTWTDPGTVAGSPLTYATYYNGQFRAYTEQVSYKEEIYSSDGVNWSQGSVDAYGVEKVILNPDTGARFIITSNYEYHSGTYGGTWSNRSYNAEDAYLDKVTGKLWIATFSGYSIASVGINNDAVRSSETMGNSTITHDMPIPTNTGAWATGVIAHDGVIVVLLSAGTEVIVSTDDGTTWNLIDSLPASVTVYGGAYLNGRFMVRTSHGSYPILYSDDNGASWTSIEPANDLGMTGQKKHVIPISSVFTGGAFFVTSDHSDGPRVTRFATKTPSASEFFLPQVASLDANFRNIIKTV